jgi:queuine tRNA-ribosyltransferase
MRNEQHRLDSEPFERDCDCEACQSFSRGYIRHLFNAGEMLGPTLTSIHNLRFYQRFMSSLRERIRERRLDAIERDFPIVSESAELTPKDTR